MVHESWEARLFKGVLIQTLADCQRIHDGSSIERSDNIEYEKQRLVYEILNLDGICAIAALGHKKFVKKALDILEGRDVYRQRRSEASRRNKD